MNRLRALALVALAMALEVVVPAPPASAAATTTGGATFNGTATLPTFPCPPPPPYGTGPCSGTFAGQWTGHVSGVSGTSAFDVAWTTQTTSTTSPPAVSVNFLYNEWACLAGSEAGIGTAQGSGTATAGPGQIRGSWQVAGEQLPRDINGATLTFQFTWARVGNSAAITLTPVALRLNVAGFASPVTVISTPQHGQASFVPTSSAGTVVPSCGTPLTNVKGLIAGEITLTGSS